MLNLIDPTVELVGVALVAGTFVAWWWLTLPVARVQAARDLSRQALHGAVLPRSGSLHVDHRWRE